jgi:hypothetical protein
MSVAECTTYRSGVFDTPIDTIVPFEIPSGTVQMYHVLKTSANTRCAFCSTVEDPSTQRVEVFNFQSRVQGSGKVLLNTVWNYYKSKYANPIVWVGVDMNQEDPYSLIRKVYEPLGYYFPGKIPNKYIPCRDQKKDQPDYYVRETTSPFFGISGPRQFASGYKSKVIGEFLTLHSLYQVRMNPEEVGQLRISLRERNERSFWFYDNIGKITAIRDSGMIGTGCRVPYKPFGELPQMYGAYYILHTHPYMCYSEGKSVFGWPSIQDMVSVLNYADKPKVNGALVLAQEGVYLVQLHPLIRFAIQKGLLIVTEELKESIKNTIHEYFGQTIPYEGLRTVNVVEVGGMEKLQESFGDEPINLTIEDLNRLSELAAIGNTSLLTPDQVLFIASKTPDMLRSWLVTANGCKIQVGGMRLPLFSCQFLPKEKLGDPFHFKV